MAKDPRCPKCNGKMDQGFIPNYGKGGRAYVSSWFEGLPEKSFWGVRSKHLLIRGYR
jgi:hypothetical protein